MRCSDFLRHYSEYRDGLIHDAALRRRMTRHMAQCPACQRYDHTITHGVSALRREPELEPSDRFRVRLRCQLAFDSARRRRTMARRARVVASMVVTAAVAFMIYEGFADTSTELTTPTALAKPAMPMVTANAGVPFVTFEQLTAPTPRSIPTSSIPVMFVDSAYYGGSRPAPVMTVNANLR
jgi:predicted anti-sigma-YlaC factor YlaD